MRKVLILFLVVVLAFSCTGCFQITLDRGYELHQDKSQIKSISLCVEFRGDPLKQFKTLDPSQFDVFIDDFEALPFADKWLIVLLPAAIDPSFYFGEYVIRFEYLDGSVELISDCDFQEYKSVDAAYSQTEHYSIDKDPWYDFLEKYFGGAVVRPE